MAPRRRLLPHPHPEVPRPSRATGPGTKTQMIRAVDRVCRLELRVFAFCLSQNNNVPVRCRETDVEKLCYLKVDATASVPDERYQKYSPPQLFKTVESMESVEWIMHVTNCLCLFIHAMQA